MTMEPDTDIAIGLLKSLLENATEYPIPEGKQERENEGGHSDPIFYKSSRTYWYAPAHTLTQKQKRLLAERLEELACIFLERAVLFRRDVPSDIPAPVPDSDAARVDATLGRTKQSILHRLEARRRAGSTA